MGEIAVEPHVPRRPFARRVNYYRIIFRSSRVGEREGKRNINLCFLHALMRANVGD